MSGRADFDQHDAYVAARALARAIDALEDRFPPDELSGLYARLRMAAVEVGARIAEGFARDGVDDKGRLSERTSEEALSRLAELRHYILTCRDRFFLDDMQVASLDALYERVRVACAEEEPQEPAAPRRGRPRAGAGRKKERGRRGA